MTPADASVFAEAMLLLSETFNEPVSDLRTSAYFDALSDLDMVDVNRAVRTALRTCKFFPRPAELREILTGSPTDNSELAWASVLNEIRRVGWCGTPKLDARTMRAIAELWGGWIPLCEKLPGEGPELLGWAKQFKAIHAATAVSDAKQLTGETIHSSVRAFIATEQKRLGA